MKIKKLSILCCLAICCLFATVACHEDAVLPTSSPDETGSLTLQFQLTPASVTRGDGSGVTELFYTVQDGELVPCEAPKAMPTTKAIGDGDVADGGGMADLHVFLVDAVDNIVARQSFSYSTNPTTTQEVTFRGLTLDATYTAYAYANTVGNNWFAMPDADETSFATYKDALLKPLDEGEAPTIANGRMPLTGKQQFTISSDNLGTIEMLRPVARLEVDVINNRTAGTTTDAITTGNIDFGSLFPKTGYVFKHDEMYGADKGNTYFPLNSSEEHPVLPGSSHVVLNTLLYETTGSEITLSMNYKYANFNYEEDMASNKVQGNITTTTKMVIKLYQSDNTSSKDHFLGLEKDESGYHLVLIPAEGLENNSIWYLDGQGNGKKRGLHNLAYDVYINLDNSTLSYTSSPYIFSFSSSSNGAFPIGDGYYLAYDSTRTPPFYVSTTKTTLFQFYTYVEGTGGGSISNKPINIEESTETESKPLTAIYRNQYVKINIVFN